MHGGTATGGAPAVPPPSPGERPVALRESEPRPRVRMPAADRRRQILDVAARLIGERGFQGLAVQDVATACGISLAGLLHHVGSKDRLLIEVLTYRDQVDLQVLGDDLGVDPRRMADGGHVAPVEDFCDALVRRNARQPEMVRLFTVLNAESLNPDHPAHDHFVRRAEHVTTWFTTLLEGRCPDPGRRAVVVLSAMDGLQLRWLRTPDTIDLVEAWQDTAEFLFADLAPVR